MIETFTLSVKTDIQVFDRGHKKFHGPAYYTEVMSSTIIKNTFVTQDRKPRGQQFYWSQQEFSLVVCSFCSSNLPGCITPHLPSPTNTITTTTTSMPSPADKYCQV